jgi:hypothetical protein
MSTVKITDLPVINYLQANTAQTVFLGVDIPTYTTYQFTATTLASGLYSNNPLAVGNNQILFPNTIAQFSGNVASYMQVNQQNFSNVGTSDYIITADTGNNTTGYIDLGINNSQWNPVAAQQTAQYPLDGYLVVQGDGIAVGNLVIGTITQNANVVFAVGGLLSSNIVATMTANGLAMNTNTSITFGDGTIQRTAAASNAYSQAAFALSNTNSTTISYLSGIEVSQNANIAYAMATANIALQNTTGIFNGSLTFTGDITANNLYGVSQLEFTTGNGLIRTFNRSGGQKDINVIAGNDLGVANGGSITLTAGSTIAPGYNGGNINLVANGNNSVISLTSNNVNISGNLIPSTSNIYNIGLNTNRWNNIYANNSLHLLDTITGNDVAISVASGVLQFNNSSAIALSNNLIISANGQIQANNIAITGNLAVNNIFTVSVPAKTLNMNGSITMTGGVVTVNNSTASVGTNYGTLMRIDASNTFAAQAPTANGYLIQAQGYDGVPAKVILDSSGTGAYSVFAGRMARGTAAAPTQPLSGDVLSRFTGNGYGNTGYSATGTGRMDIIALDNFSDSTKGTQITFSVIPAGSNVITQNVVTITSNTLTANAIVANTVTANAVTSTLSVVNTWTPNVSFSTANGTMTYTAQYGNYVKTGRQVTAYFTLNVTNSGGSGNMFINGLPYTATSGSGSVGVTVIAGAITGPSTGNMGPITGNVIGGATSTQLYVINNTGNGSMTDYPVTAGTGTGGIGSPFTINGYVSYISAN